MFVEWKTNDGEQAKLAQLRAKMDENKRKAAAAEAAAAAAVPASLGPSPPTGFSGDFKAVAGHDVSCELRLGPGFGAGTEIGAGHSAGAVNGAGAATVAAGAGSDAAEARRHSLLLAVRGHRDGLQSATTATGAGAPRVQALQLRAAVASVRPKREVKTLLPKEAPGANGSPQFQKSGKVCAAAIARGQTRVARPPPDAIYVTCVWPPRVCRPDPSSGPHRRRVPLCFQRQAIQW